MLIFAVAACAADAKAGANAPKPSNTARVTMILRITYLLVFSQGVPASAEHDMVM